jgi:RNA polymerase sigma factor (sigma-70 family)
LTPEIDFKTSTELHAGCSSADPVIQTAAYELLWRYLYQVTTTILHDQPDPSSLAQDCAQRALVRVYEQLQTCREPAAFRAWARRIAGHIAIDELRRRKRLVSLPDLNPGGELETVLSVQEQRHLETIVLSRASLAELKRLLDLAPISDRSRRVVIGRYLNGTPDETLAEIESKLTDRDVYTSHIQVTRAKNLTKLRNWELLRRLLAESD